MTCKKCGQNNRPEAKYCRFCGEPIAVESTQKGLLAKDSLVPQLDELDKKLKVARANLGNGTRIGMDCLILGDSGTGKNFIARLVSSRITAAGIVSQAPKVVDAADWGEFAGDFEKNIGALRDGILVITNAQKLLPTTRAKEVNQLDKLFSRMHGAEGAPIVLLCGMLNDMLEFLEHNKAERSLFEFEFRLDTFGIEDLTRLTEELWDEKYHVKASEAALNKLSSHFAWYMRQKEVGYINGHLSEMVAETLFVNAASRGSKIIDEQDIDSDKCFVPKTEEEILAELDQYIGLKSVKDEIRAIVRDIKAKKKGGMKEKLLKDHYLFTGNPGTGKTTIARKFGEVLSAIGALPTGQFVEISGKDFIGQYVGDSEANVKNYVNKAMGGVLFIDEAYALNGSAGSNGSFGMDAVNTLLNLLENRKGEFVCIMAGYTKEMAEFVRMNPGIPSRCNVTIEFPDYSAAELEQIFRMYLVRNGETRGGEPVRFTLDAKADEMLPKVCERMYLRRTDTFGNAREVRNLFDKAVKRLRARGADDVITYADLVGEEATKELSVEDVMKEMDQFVGMASVKDAIRRIASEIAVQKRLIEMGEGSEGLTKYNFILTGNPGTGKTSVANTLGKIFYALGVTSTDRVTKKEPKDIISQFNNESAKVMDAAITEAMGGILFIDEAYGLNPVDNAGQGTNPEGKKALETLMTRMENEAGKFVVICAGYPKEMDDFLKANPGLPRRFSHRIHIDDYTAEELLEIYERAAKAKKYNFTLADEAARMKALNMFQNMVAMKTERFGNAGEAIKKVAETKTNINNRLMAVEEWTPEVLASARLAFQEDIPYEEPQKVSIEECLAELNELIGLEGVKSSLTKLAHTINNEIESARLEGRRPDIPLGHYLFLGNPGTGKTTVARLMGKILYSMGALPSPKVVEVDKSKLVGRYLGDTPAITSNVINSAMGGILFIDEAYQLSSEGYNGGAGGYGKEALETLLKRLEDDRGKFVCIAAGYSYEMQSFIAANSGIESRFPRRNWITFEDYTPDELFRIFMLYVKKGGYTLDPMAEHAVKAKLTGLYNNRERTFGNAREARNLFDDVKGNLAARLAEDGGAHTPEERKTIMMEDVL